MKEDKMDQGVYTFLKKRGLHVSDMNVAIQNYARVVLDVKKPKSQKRAWTNLISREIQDDFDSFKFWVGNNFIAGQTTNHEYQLN